MNPVINQAKQMCGRWA